MPDTAALQLLTQPTPQVLAAIEAAIQPARLQRYMPAADQDKDTAFAYYLWNCAICEAFYTPLHFVEVTARNCIQKAIESKWGDRWFESQVFYQILDRYYRSELDEVISKEARQHGTPITSDHVASSLSFGFIEHIATKRFAGAIWKRGVKPFFPGAPAAKSYEHLQVLLQSVRRFRNRVAHHEAVFDKAPTRKFNDTMELLSWASPETATWIQSVARVQQAINLRPVKPPAAAPADAPPPPEDDGKSP